MWIRIIKSGLTQSVERLFYKTPGRRFRPQWFFSVLFLFVFFVFLFFLFFFVSSFFFFFFFLLLFSFIIVILNYCEVDYKVFIIRNNKLIYLSRM